MVAIKERNNVRYYFETVDTQDGDTISIESPVPAKVIILSADNFRKLIRGADFEYDWMEHVSEFPIDITGIEGGKWHVVVDPDPPAHQPDVFISVIRDETE